MNQPPPKTLTTAEVAAALEVTERTVFSLREAGRLDAKQVGRTWEYSAASVRAELLRRKGLA